MQLQLRLGYRAEVELFPGSSGRDLLYFRKPCNLFDIYIIVGKELGMF